MLNLCALEKLLEKGKNFEFTEEQYEKTVKKSMPKTYYLKTNSPVARKAKAYGYTIQVEERTRRVLVFTKVKNIRK